MQPLDTPVAALVAVSMVGLVGFAVILFAIIKLRLMITSKSLHYALIGFAFLTVAQALSTASYYVDVEVLAYSYYVGAASSAAMGYIALALATLGKPASEEVTAEAKLVAALSPIILLPLSIELLAMVSSILAASRSRGVFRKALFLIGVSHMLKVLALSLGLPGLWLFLLAETMRSGAASALAVYYARSVLAS